MPDLKKINYPIPANTFADTGEPIERNASGIPLEAYAVNPDQALAGQIFSTNGEAEAKAETKKPGKKDKAAEQEPDGEAEAKAETKKPGKKDKAAEQEPKGEGEAEAKAES